MNVVKINMREVVTLRVLMLHEYWEKLQQEFIVNVEFKILSDIDYLHKIFNDLKKNKTSEKDIEFVTMFIEKEFKSMEGTIMVTEWKPSQVDGVIHVEDLIVFMRQQTLKNYIFKTLNNSDADKNLKILLRHEMGHVLDALSFEGMEFSKFERINNERRDEKHRILDEANKSRPEHFKDNIEAGKWLAKIKNSLPNEKIANEKAGIGEEMIEATLPFSPDKRSLIEFFYE